MRFCIFGWQYELLLWLQNVCRMPAYRHMLRVTGINHNEYIVLMNDCKTQALL
jgi:hypothetical protein